MPKAGTIGSGSDEIDYYEISMRQFEPVSYTHLKLPTSGLVEISVGAVSLKKKNKYKTHDTPDTFQ